MTDEGSSRGDGADRPIAGVGPLQVSGASDDVPSGPDEFAPNDDGGDLDPDDSLVEGEGPPAPTIFVSDPTVEAARIEWALRARGYVVIDVPLAMLAGRVAVQRPHLVLLDVDAANALETAARVRQLPGATGIHLLYAGIAGKTFESAKDAFAHEGSGFFVRPIDIDALVAKVDSLLGYDAGAHLQRNGMHGDRPPQSVSPPRHSSRPPPSLQGNRPPPSSLSGRAPQSPTPPRPADPPPSLRLPSDPPEVPSSDLGPRRAASARVAETRLSPDLERLLREAEQRVAGPVSQRAPESVPHSDEELLSPEAEVEAVLPAEILASLDEPLDLELDDEDGGSSETGGAHHSTTGRGPQDRPESRDSRTSAAVVEPIVPHDEGSREETHGGSPAPAESAASDQDSASLTTSAGTSRARGIALPEPSVVSATAATSAGRVSSQRESEDAAPPTRAASAIFLDTHGAVPEALVARDAQTPRPPRRIPGPPVTDHARGVADSVIDDRSRSQISRDLPPPAFEHPPPLAPQTSRPPPIRRDEPFAARAEPEPEYPPPQPRMPMETAPLPQPRAITSPDESVRALASAVATRITGVLRYDEANGIRRVVLQDGDVVTAASSVEGESLLGYLVGRGDLAADVARRLEGRVPPFGRLAGAALVAHGHLHQEQLWDVLQAHAAWLLTRAIAIPRGRVAFEAEPPQRLRGEPPVFGGTPGPSLVVEIVRRAVTPADAIARLGGLDTRFTPGAQQKLIDECGLEEDEELLLRRANGTTLRELAEQRGDEVPQLLYALAALGVVEPLLGIRPGAAVPGEQSAPLPGEGVELADPLRDAELDDAAVRARIVARRTLVEDGDYFAILGVARDATGYEIKRAYVDTRRALDPSRVMRPSLLDVADDLKLVLSVLDEAYDVLKDATRRERYRRAITHEAPRR